MGTYLFAPGSFYEVFYDLKDVSSRFTLVFSASIRSVLRDVVFGSFISISRYYAPLLQLI